MHCLVHRLSEGIDFFPTGFCHHLWGHLNQWFFFFCRANRRASLSCISCISIPAAIS
jgi:hypothetical protein